MTARQRHSVTVERYENSRNQPSDDAAMVVAQSSEGLSSARHSSATRWGMYLRASAGNRERPTQNITSEYPATTTEKTSNTDVMPNALVTHSKRAAMTSVPGTPTPRKARKPASMSRVSPLTAAMPEPSASHFANT